MKRPGFWVSLVCVGAWVAAAAQQPGADRAALLRSLPQATKLPSGYRPVSELAGRGVFYSASAPLFRIDDGAAGAPGSFTAQMYFIPEETYLAWETEPPGL